ncbi:MAG: hypothetical protein IKO83_06890 [Oscillospiraceae bacterium]|nr:hypothetical protein [Oscillospiraceae bacterium]
MKRRLALILLLAAAALSLCGCGRIFDTEYVVETSFEPVVNAAAPEADDTTAASLDDLMEVLRGMVAEGDVSRVIRFDPAYTGDVSADLASACWQIRTQDALCAYCVENISYELSKIVNHYEALLSVQYSKTAEALESIVQLPYAADAGELLREAMVTGQRSLVLLIERSSYSAEALEDFILQIYHEAPTISPLEPRVSVSMTSGADTQRLYVIDFDYGMSAEEHAARCEAMAALDLFMGTDLSGLSEAERALLACCGLIVRSRYTEDSAKDSVYDALIGREANDHGLALAYVEYCRRMGLDCETIHGQRGGEAYTWNIVQIDGAYYHVDTAVCSRLGVEAGFLLDDESAWGTYRWDYFAYPHCTGPLTYAELVHPSPDRAVPDAGSVEPEERIFEDGEKSP